MGIFTAIIVLGVLIFVHELGHFLVAKYCGVGVLEFAIGFGPKLLRWQGKETTYSLRAVPLGGFVRMAGDDPSMVYGDAAAGVYGDAAAGTTSEVAGASPIEGVQEELTPQQLSLLKDETRWFLKKAYLPKCAIVLAGPLANFLFAWILAFGSYLAVGLPTLIDGPVTIGGVQKGLPAESAGLKVGDKVVSVDGQTVTSFGALVNLVRNSGGKTLEFVVQRSNTSVEGNSAQNQVAPEVLSVQVKPLSDASPELDILEGKEVNQTYRIGITPSMDNALSFSKVGPVQAGLAASGQVVELSMQTLRVLKGLVTGLLSPSRTIGGPIEIIKQTAESAKRGMVELVFMMIMLNVTLAVMNLLPIPVLDGGHLTFFTLEKLRGKPLSMRAQAAVMNVGLIILLSLMVFAVGNDIRRAFS
jgi:regulator of sigma E protease